MDIAIHARVESLVCRRAGSQFGVQDDLVEWRKIGIHPQLFRRAGQHGSTGYLGPRSTKGGDPYFIHSRLLTRSHPW